LDKKTKAKIKAFQSAGVAYDRDAEETEQLEIKEIVRNYNNEDFV